MAAAVLLRQRRRSGCGRLVEQRVPEIDARAVNTIPLGVDAEGREIVVRVGRYGPYLSRGEATAPVPDGIAPDELTPEMATELLEKGPEEGRVLGSDPATGLEVSVRDGRYGPYVQLGEQEEGSKKKPKRASLFKTMTPDTVALDEALMLLSLPRVVGQDAEGKDIVASPGRFGPYIKRGEDTRSLKEEDQLLTVTLEEALELLATAETGPGPGRRPSRWPSWGPTPTTARSSSCWPAATGPT